MPPKDTTILVEIKARIDDLRRKLGVARAELTKTFGNAAPVENLRRRIGDLRENIGDMRQELANTGDELSGTFSDVASIVAGIGIFSFINAVISGMRQLVGEVVRLGIEFGNVQRKLELEGGGRGAARAYVRAIQEATDGLVDRVTAADIAITALNNNIAKTPEEMAKWARVAVILSDGNAELANSFLEMAAGGTISVEQLNRYGLSATDVRRRARELREENNSLTTDMANRLAIFDAATEKADQLSDSLDQNAQAVQRAQTAWGDFTADMGEASDVGMGEGVAVVELLNEKLRELLDLPESTTQLENLFLAPTVAGHAYGVVLRQLWEGSITLSEAEAVYLKTFEKIGIEYGLLSTEASRAADEQEALAKSSRSAAEAADEGVGNAERLAAAYDELRRQSATAAESVKKGFADMGGAVDFSNIFDGLSDEIRGQLQGIAEVRGAGEGEGLTREDLAKIVLRQIKRETNDPEIIWRFMVAAGLATEQQIQWERELYQLAHLAATGKITPEMAARGVGAIAGGGSAAGLFPGGIGPQGIDVGGLSGYGRGAGMMGQDTHGTPSAAFGQPGQVHVRISVSDPLIDARIVSVMGDVYAEVAGGTEKGIVPRGKLNISGRSRR